MNLLSCSSSPSVGSGCLLRDQHWVGWGGWWGWQGTSGGSAGQWGRPWSLLEKVLAESRIRPVTGKPDISTCDVTANQAWYILWLRMWRHCFQLDPCFLYCIDCMPACLEAPASLDRRDLQEISRGMTSLFYSSEIPNSLASLGLTPPALWMSNKTVFTEIWWRRWFDD